MKNRVFLLIIPIAVYIASFYFDQFDPEAVREQRVLITGASTGIGEQLAYQYAELGARLVITARRTDLLRNISKTCEKLGARQVSFFAADMEDAGDRLKLIKYVEDQLGGLDHLVLNHAYLLQKWWQGDTKDMSILQKTHQINFLSFVDLTSKAMPMLTTSRGRIGIVSSGLGEQGTVFATVYSSSKFAVNAFFSSLRQELRQKKIDVSITVIILGPVSTDSMLDATNEIPMKMPKEFMATPSTSARAILESVALRRFKIYFDWKMWFYAAWYTFFPISFEDTMARVTLNVDDWFFSALFFFWRMFY